MRLITIRASLDSNVKYVEKTITGMELFLSHRVGHMLKVSALFLALHLPQRLNGVKLQCNVPTYHREALAQSLCFYFL